MFWDNWFKRNKGNDMEITEEMHPDIDEMLTAEAEGIMVWNETSNEFLMTTAKGRSSSSMNSGVDLPGGVKVSSSKAKAGETLTIRYNGLLGSVWRRLGIRSLGIRRPSVERRQGHSHV